MKKKRNGKRETALSKKDLKKLEKDGLDLSKSIRIDVNADIPDEIIEEYGLSLEEVREVLSQSSALVYQCLMGYIEEKSGKKKREYTGYIT